MTSPEPFTADRQTVDPWGAPYGMRLHASHARELAASGISAKVAASRGYVSAEAKTDLSALGFRNQQLRTPGMVVPVWGLDRTRLFCEYKADDPRTNSDGKQVKYDRPSGQGNRLNVHPDVLDQVLDHSVDLWFTEGTKKADSAITAGLACIPLIGVWGWRASDHEALADFDRIPLRNRRVRLCFDSDVTTKPGVEKAMEAFKTFLEERDGHVEIVYLCDGPDGAKVGLDDYFVDGHSVTELQALATPTLRRTAPRERLTLVTDTPPVVQVDEPEGDDLDPSWEPVDLGPAWRGEKIRPAATVFTRDDGLALLLPGINYVFGDSGDGKSFVALLAVLSEVRADHPAIWVSYEDANEDLLVERLKLLGATEHEAMQVIFIAPQMGLTDGAQHIAELAATAGVRLVILDSVGEAMAVGGVDEDKDKEVGPWFRQTLRLIHDADPNLAIWPIDHSTKSKDNPLHPSGSKRKRAAPTGRAYLLNVRTPFAKDAVGYVQLVTAKDRGGTFPRGAIAAEIMLDATTTPYTFTVTAPRDGDNYSPKAQRRNAGERVVEVLSEATTAVTAAEIQRVANSAGRIHQGETPLSLKTVQNALSKLAKGPRVQPVKTDPEGPGRYTTTLWRYTDPDSGTETPDEP